jgi:hypothetical protein
MRFAIIVPLVLALTMGRALAQPVEEPPPTPAPPVPVPAPQPQPHGSQPPPYQTQPQPYGPQPDAMPVPCGPGATDARCLKQILETDPAYAAAKGRRTTGIVLTAVGPSVGVVTMLVAGMVAIVRDIGCSRNCSYTSEKVAAGVGGGMAVLGLAVGIPLIVSGGNEMAAIRDHYLNQLPRAGLTLGPGHAMLTTTWSF